MNGIIIPDEEVSTGFDAYDDLINRRQARRRLFEEGELLEALTGEDEPYSDDIGGGMRIFLWVVLAVFALMTLAGSASHLAGGFALAGMLAVLWCWLVSAATEVAASADGAGNMYRNQRTGRSPEWDAQRAERVEIVETIVEHEDPQALMAKLDDPSYIKELMAAMKRDEEGWTMSAD